MKPNKKEKKGLARKDFEKKRNILKNWNREQRNRIDMGLEGSLTPVQFKRSKKINKVNK